MQGAVRTSGRQNLESHRRLEAASGLRRFFRSLWSKTAERKRRILMSQKLTVRSLLNQKASRRALALRIGTLVFSGVMVAVIRTPPVDGASPAEITRPNILLIVADDQGYADLGCTGLADDVRTPNLDRLAQRGSPMQRHQSAMLRAQD
jgi:hypothetical protein